MSQIVPDLSEKQHQAIELIINGQNFSDIASALDIDRRTLWRWRQLPDFQQAHAERKAALRSEMQERVHNIMHLSLMVVERELASTGYAKPLGTALQVLKLASLPTLIPTDNIGVEK